MLLCKSKTMMKANCQLLIFLFVTDNKKRPRRALYAGRLLSALLHHGILNALSGFNTMSLGSVTFIDLAGDPTYKIEQKQWSGCPTHDLP